MIKYTEITNERGEKCIVATGENYEMVIPCDPANSDYQAYLNKDKPQVEHLTEILPTEQPTCATKIAWYNANRLTLPRLRGHYE